MKRKVSALIKEHKELYDGIFFLELETELAEEGKIVCLQENDFVSVLPLN